MSSIEKYKIRDQHLSKLSKKLLNLVESPKGENNFRLVICYRTIIFGPTQVFGSYELKFKLLGQ